MKTETLRGVVNAISIGQTNIEEIASRFPYEYTNEQEYIELQMEIADYAREGVTVYSSMWEYVSRADISNYNTMTGDRFDSYRQEQHARKFGSYAFAFRPVDDPHFWVDADTRFVKDGRWFVLVNWGEDNNSFVPEDRVDGYFWGVYDYDPDTKTATPRSNIFRTQEDAESEY